MTLVVGGCCIGSFNMMAESPILTSACMISPVGAGILMISSPPNAALVETGAVDGAGEVGDQRWFACPRRRSAAGRPMVGQSLSVEVQYHRVTHPCSSRNGL